MTADTFEMLCPYAKICIKYKQMNSTSFYLISLYTATIIEQIKRLCNTRVKFNVSFGCFKSRMI